MPKHSTPTGASILRALALIPLVASQSCTCSKGADPPAVAPAGVHETEWAVHLVIGDQRVDFLPVRDLSAPRGISKSMPVAAGAPTSKSGKLTTKSTVAVDGGVVSTPEFGDFEYGSYSAWNLLWGAAVECGMRGGAGPALEPPRSRVFGDQPTIPPWSEPGSFYIFPQYNRAPSCDGMLEKAETLLCVSQKLADAADAVAPTTWSATKYVTPPAGIPAGEWTVLVQADKDRFILRDLAIHTLAQLAFMDGYPIDVTTSPESCSRIYGQISRDPGSPLLTLAFGVPSGSLTTYPPGSFTLPGGFWERQSIVGQRLSFETHVLRGGARLLEDLIRKSVASDLAGAERRSTQVLDPNFGQGIAWGVNDKDNGPFNSLAHATRILTGRWEIGPNASLWDPQCGGAKSLDALPYLYTGLRARSTDAPILTTEQRLAVEQVEQSGVALPLNAISVTSPGTLRTAVKEQLRRNAAARNGVAPTSTTANGDQAQAIGVAIDAISDPDLKFALRRASRTYELLAAPYGDEFTLFDPTAYGLKTATSVAPEVTALGGYSLDGGIARTRVKGDPIARNASLLSNAQCNEPLGLMPMLAADHLNAPPGSTGQPLEVRQVASFQDSFGVGQSFERRLGVIYHQLSLAGGALPDGPQQMIGGARAEVRSWAGHGRITATTPGGWGQTPDSITLHLTGFDEGDLGITTAADAQKQLVLVYGHPFVAECAARLRTDCPADFEANYVKTVDSATIGGPHTPEFMGTNRPDLVAFFDLTSSRPPTFYPPYRWWGEPDGAAHVYVVLRHDPKNQSAARGKVLGTVALHYSWMTTETVAGFVVSDLQRDLLESVVGFGKETYGPTVGMTTAATSDDYCLPGVPRNLFVPLENELTSDGDGYESSWKHYLQLAKLAAARADDLGQKMVDFGFQKELRREGAAEGLADVCGDFSALGSLKTSPEGKSTTDDPTLAVCLSEPTVDVVYLGTDRSEGLDATAKQLRLLKDLGCKNEDGSDGPGKSNPLCATAALTSGGLGFGAAPVDTSNCSAMLEVARGFRTTGFRSGEMGSVLNAGWATDDGLATIARSIRFEMGLDGEWKVVAGGATVMSSATGPLWPGCLRTPSSCNFATNELSKGLNDVFRRCDEATKGTAVLGNCETSPSSGVDWARAELNALAWRVQGAIWLLGASTGLVQEKAITLPIPAVDFTAWGSTTQDAVAATFFNPGRFDFASGKYILQSPGTAEDRNQLGDVVAIGAVFGQLSTTQLNDEMPAPLKEVYTTPSFYRHLLAANEPLRLKTGDIDLGGYKSSGATLKSFFAGKDHVLPDGRIDNRGLRILAQGLDGMRCPTVTGAPVTAGKWADADIVVALGAVKTNVGLDREVPKGGSMWLTVPEAHGLAHPVGLSLPPASRTCDMPRAVLQVAKLPGAASPPLYDSFGGVSPPGMEWLVGRYSPRMSAAGTPLSYTASEVKPSRRVGYFANAGAACTTCGAAAEFVQAMTLACLTRKAPTLATYEPTPPPVTKLDDLAQLEGWLSSIAKTAQGQVARLYLEKVPKRVIEDFRTKSVGTGSKKGAHGQKIVEMEAQLQAVAAAWGELSKEMGAIRTAMEATRLRLVGVEIAGQEALIEIAIQQYRIYGDMGRVVGDFIGSFGRGPAGPVGSAISGGSSVAVGLMTLDKLDGLKRLKEAKDSNEVAKALLDLQAVTTPAWTNIDKQIGNIRAATAQLLVLGDQINGLKDKAGYLAAKGSGADFFRTSDGKVVPLPVNTVLNRQYDVTKLRYERALADAKYLTFLARRAIEQRVGVPLKDIAVKVGALDAPALWADKLCSLQGIKYDDLKKPDPDAGPVADKAVLESFADQYIGDYVAKLENFVEYYNVEYPSHDGDDTAILSLRQDLLGAKPVCTAKARNLLYYSGSLDQTAVAAGTKAPDDHRWEVHACATPLKVFSGAALAAYKAPPGDTARGGVSWLRGTVSAGVGDAGSTSGGTAGGPCGMVSQTVQLNPGTYLVSWWDQARDATGALPTSDGTDYRVEVYGATWEPVAGLTSKPYRVALDGSGAPTAALWGTRRVLTFTVTTAGAYHVSFGASVPGGPDGSVAIANVQLERAAPGGTPTSYVGTDSLCEVVTSDCPTLSPEDMRAAFQWRCDAVGKQCFYELTAPFLIDTGVLNAGRSTLEGKLARGNFNFRHIDVAVNLVGTGVRDCTTTPSPDCFGSGFLEYTLEHDGMHSPILDWHQVPRVFDFGIAPIEHGKALAAERYITLPMGSADGALLGQPGITKPEFRGRPLDGNYRLRIFDSPALRWNRLEDVQIVLKYRYWSRINKSSKG